MSSSRRWPSVSVKRSLLAGAALAVLAGAPALAQTQASETPAPEAAVGPDGLAQDELYLEANLVERNDQTNITTASGDVEVRYNGRTIRAQELVYDQNRGVMTARGQVVSFTGDGALEYAEELVIDDEMKAGVALGFAARLQGDVKLAAATAIRRNEDVNELRQAIYTPCPVCAGDEPKTPSWSIRADKIVQDHPRQLVYYRNATLMVKGVPVLYLPLFWHTDPQAVRKSGFLTPNISVSDRRGFSYEQPYLWVLSPSADLTLSPQINTSVNPFLNGRLRKRFYSGQVDLRFGYGHDQDFDSNGVRFGEQTNRSYVLASGAFQPAEHWLWGFTAERVSEKYLFDKYEVDDVYETRGPYLADDRRLVSQVYATRQDARSYVSAAAMTFQGLRPSDNDRTFPIVAPLVEARWDPGVAVMGGRVRVAGSGVVLEREQSPLNPLVRTPGLDSRRATARADWRASYTSAGGVRVDPFAEVRGDFYSLGDRGAGAGSKSRARALGVIGADVTYPFYRRFSDATVVVEPVAQIALSPAVDQIVIGRQAGGRPIYLNEDSASFEFDETTLFRANKFPGFDLYEGGARLNVGLRAVAYWDDGRRANLVVGRSFRDKRDDTFPERTGLRERASDWIVAASANPINGLTFFTRARLDSDTLDVRRAEAGANFYNRRASGFFRYLRDNVNLNGARTENLDVGGELRLTKNWGVSVYGNRDLVQDAWVIRDLGVYYKDDCTRVDVIYRREDTVLGRLGPSDAISVRLTLATLGQPINAR